MERGEWIASGIAGLAVLLVAAQFEPQIVGAVLVTFSLVVFVMAVVGLVKPSWVRIPNRLAAVWVWALSVGLFFGGAVLLSPPNGEITASDVGPEQEAAAHLREAAGCFERNRHRILEIAGELSRRAQIRGELTTTECLSSSSLSLEARALMVDAIGRIDIATLGRATNEIGMNRALDSVIAGFNRQANRLSPGPE